MVNIKYTGENILRPRNIEEIEQIIKSRNKKWEREDKKLAEKLRKRQLKEKEKANEDRKYKITNNRYVKREKKTKMSTESILLNRKTEIRENKNDLDELELRLIYINKDGKKQRWPLANIIACELGFFGNITKMSRFISIDGNVRNCHINNLERIPLKKKSEEDTTGDERK